MDEKKHVTLVYVCPFRTYNAYPPLGLAYLAASLRSRQYPVTIVDTTFQSENDALEAVESHSSALIGFLVLQTNFAQSGALARKARLRFPRVPIAFGGPYPTTCPDSIFKLEEIDLVFRGEGEFAILEIMEFLEGTRLVADIDGLCFRENSQPVIKPPRFPIVDLNSVPFPAYDLLPMEDYLKVPMEIPLASPAATLNVTRGCYGNCTYCQPLSRNLFGSKIKRFSPQSVIEQLQWLIQHYNIRSVSFTDDEPFWKGESWWHELAGLLKKNAIRLNFLVNSRVDTVDEALFSALKRVGLKYVAFGVESGSNTILSNLRKGYRADEIVPAFKTCRKLGIVSRANVMIGSPGETWNTIQETMSMLTLARPDIISISVTTPIPGTDLYESLSDRLGTDFMASNQLDRKHILSIASGFSEKDVLEAINRIFRLFMMMSLFDVLLRPWRKWPLIKMIVAREISLFRIHPTAPFKDIAFHFGYTKKSFT